ncbi:acyl carrier protein [candidate division KSB1 bacterium]|nr:acyl carrier protein [candidate division KSB1 bacterium]
MDVKTKIRSFIVENFMYGDAESLHDLDSFRQKGIIDSTGILELIAFLEETFEIKIDDEEIIPENLDSTENIHAFISHKVAGSKSRKIKVSL